ncbi:type II toxin-antitoxin system RelE/ParE family toxin [Fulvivirgaceae bacterium PWU4]|uniref:Type II toxin-antitoxin system RelE/ParE family toxin n=1 Tax=Chryseosolibacter histidini TaxID=2782349 RepID=A0AAP2DI69_9BACT|nr:type II toxin-antitoxin system RelE/ParE family toxin [Chryseosolibacter histidini]
MAEIVITWTPFALRCLDEIHYFISEEAGSPHPADRFVEKIFARTNQLKSHPESGQQDILLAERGLHCRYLVEGNYKIIYEYIESKMIIVIIDVFHTRQNPQKILNR